MPSIFSKIVSGEIPCHRVWEDEEHLAFLDIQPWAEGHTLIIPKREEDYLFDLSPQRAEALWAAAHQVARLLKSKVECERVAVLVLGYEVPHAHIHLIPTQSEREVLAAQRQPTDHAALATLAARLRGDYAKDDDLDQDNQEPQEERVESTPTVDTALIEKRWDEFSDRFVSGVERITMRAARAAMDHLHLTGALDVLEVGCGGGGAGLELRRRLDQLAPEADLTLTDLSLKMVKLAQSRFTLGDVQRPLRGQGSLGSVVIERADAQSLPYADASFDRLFSCLNLMLVPDYIAAIKENARVLRADGKAIWVVWGRATHSQQMTLLPRALKSLGIESPPLERTPFHLGGLDTLKTALEAHGFTSVRRWYQPMVSDAESGAQVVEMIMKLRPNLAELMETKERLLELQTRLAELADEVLARGEYIGLDALVVVAHRSST